jgi:predicted lipase
MGTMRNVTVYEDTSMGTQAYTGYDSKFQRIVVAVRGTHNIDNWLENIKIEKTKLLNTSCEKCWVHKGMYMAYQSLQAFILKSVSELYNKYPSAKIWATGHSLGGSMAGLAAIDIQQNISKHTRLITFEQPRTGNSEFAKFVSRLLPDTVRITHSNDPVPHMPFRWLYYDHYGTEVHYDKNFSSFKVCDGSGFDLTCAESHSHYTLFGYSALNKHLFLWHRYTGCYTEKPKKTEEGGGKTHSGPEHFGKIEELLRSSGRIH